MSVKRVLIGGGTSFVGRTLKRALERRGIQVCVISRMPGPDSITWEDIEWKGLPGGTDAVVNLAGQNVLDPRQRWVPGYQQNIIASRVGTNQMLSDAIRKCGQDPPKVFITISGVGYYPYMTDEAQTEDSKGGYFDFLSQLCRDWERACLAAPNVRTVIVRSGVVLGPHGGIVGKMYYPFLFGLGSKIGSGNQYMPWIHHEDLANIFITAMHDPKYTGVINGVAPQLVTNGQFTKAFARVLHRPIIPFLRVPDNLLEIWLSKERAVMLTTGPKVISKRLPELGFQFQHPDIEAALKDIVTSRRSDF